MNRVSTWHIHITGQVQGVGFRPFIYQLAKKFQLSGWVSNKDDGVHMEFNADNVLSKKFYKEILINAPQLSHITSHILEEISPFTFSGFKIISSGKAGNPILLISPDFAVCVNCKKEIENKTNRRYNYAFTTCTQCGPRYSIMKDLPYDRENTVMEVFKMCPTCNAEYSDPMNRRHFSQTNSCPNCAVVMKLFDNRKAPIENDQENIIQKICEYWNDGKIVAIKGIGGYLLTCDATNANTIKELRSGKHRPAKPFALMFPDILSLEEEVYLNEAEITELKSVAAPIVLLHLKNKSPSTIAVHEIAPRLSRVGVMLPYTPLYELLLQQFKKPIVATSGNISNAPITFEDEKALFNLNFIADYILVHNREIIAPQDDSVVTYSHYFQHRIMLRRARGFAPFYLNKKLSLTEKPIIAAGAMIKSTFTLLHQQNIHISQYLGDTDNYDAQKNYEKALHHFLHLFQAQPQVFLIDKHPGYFTSQFGEQLATKWNNELVAVQHHEAHFASVLGEHNLINKQAPILGVIWDGTGFGNDGQIWGGEFFVYHQHRFIRFTHFDYFNYFLGDMMATEPRLSAFSLCHEMEEATSILQPKFSPEEWKNYHQLVKKNKLKTSSIGRLFDAVASLLGLIDKASFEGEAAMLLEEEAHHYFKSGLNIPDEWLEEDVWKSGLSTQTLIKEIIRKINTGKEKSEIAAWFHVQLILAVKKVATQNLTVLEDQLGLPFHKICFSGGVFQNGLLVDLLIRILGVQYQLYFNRELSPNDENISFGQLVRYGIGDMKYE
ncbi:MAG: carbamoyltransferase HypF [Chitinophagales bacterium]|nr:carbamoyltransferase HypF [Chitinophagales bacterium]